MKRNIFYLSLFLVLFSLGCSKSSSTNSPVRPNDPTTPVNPVNPPTNDPYGGDIRASVPINLVDKTSYTGLIDIAKPDIVELPLVGDAKVRLQISDSRSQSIDGSLFIAFEDQAGFWGARWEKAVKNTGVQTSSSSGRTVDLIFADDLLVVRTQGIVVNQNFVGALYYRLRQPGDTACKAVKTYCTVTWPGFPPYSFEIQDGQTCPGYSTPVDTVTPCRTYMNPSNPQVKQLGTFTNTFSNIATLPEAQ
ncbi:MAG: hypothetical protein ACKOA8_12365 [Deltaproteobacteria bacterium]